MINQTNLTLVWLWLSYGLAYCIASLLVFYYLMLAWDAVVLRDKEYCRDTGNELASFNIAYHDALGFASMLGVAAVVYFFKVVNPGYIAHDSLSVGSSLNRLVMLIVLFVIISIGFFVNAIMVVVKMPIDLRGLMSRERRT